MIFMKLSCILKVVAKDHLVLPHQDKLHNQYGPLPTWEFLMPSIWLLWLLDLL